MFSFEKLFKKIKKPNYLDFLFIRRKYINGMIRNNSLWSNDYSIINSNPSLI
jgi:hypothetical protein